MSIIHDSEQERLFHEKLSDICTRHRKLELQKNEPTLNERLQVRRTIFDYILKEQRIIYGGYGYHLLLQQKSKNEFIYHELDFPDVEFYTTDLFRDVKTLCDILHKSGFSLVMGEEGQHPTTFKLSINTVNYCDITFIPDRLLDTIPYVIVDGLKVAHPTYLYIDVYKVYSYPLLNYFRLKKTFTRANLLMKYYPMEYPTDQTRTQIRPMSNPYLTRDLINKIKESQSMILIDTYAFNVYAKDLGIEEVPDPYLVSVSTNYQSDAHGFYDYLRKAYPHIQIREYYPFLDYLGRRIDFYIQDKESKYMILQIYDETGNCIPYKRSKDGIKISTFQGTYYYLLVSRQKMLMDYVSTKKDLIQEKAKIKEKLIMDMNAMKKRLLKTKGCKPCFESNSLFEEFVITCEGDSVTEIRKKALRIQQRKQEKKPLRYRYNPETDKNIHEVRLDDFTAHEIKKTVNKTIL